jgi:hypothetical protein
MPLEASQNIPATLRLEPLPYSVRLAPDRPAPADDLEMEGHRPRQTSLCPGCLRLGYDRRQQ